MYIPHSWHYQACQISSYCESHIKYKNVDNIRKKINYEFIRQYFGKKKNKIHQFKIPISNYITFAIYERKYNIYKKASEKKKNALLKNSNKIHSKIMQIKC